MKSVSKSTFGKLIAKIALIAASIGASALAIAPPEVHAASCSGGCWVAGTGGNGVCVTRSGACNCCDLIGGYCVGGGVCDLGS
jgi:hypothetical protein